MFGRRNSKENGGGPLVLLVGHCGFDSGSLKRLIEQAAPDARVKGVNRRADLEAEMNRAALLLVNRKLDGAFGVPGGEHGDGVELIRELASAGNAPPCMLVSNFQGAQDAAVEAGAVPGFGKQDVRGETAERLIRSALGLGQPG